MPLIRIEYDDQNVEEENIYKLAQAMRDLVSDETRIEDVFVYANSAKIKIQIAPIEIFVEMSAQKITDVDELMLRFKNRLSEWKTENDFGIPVNLTLIPMHWKVEIGV